MEFNTSSLSEQAEKALKEEILSGRLAPEQRIDLVAYAAHWQLSPTPLRDAVKQLEAKGLVEVSPRRGVFVAKINRQVLKEIFEIRMALECKAVQLAAPIIPPEAVESVLQQYRSASSARNKQVRQKKLADIDNLVHNLVVEHSNNSRLIKLMESLNDLIRWSRWICYSTEPVPYEAALPEHLRICEALLARDGAAAVEAMRAHLENTHSRIDAQLANQGLAAAPLKAGGSKRS
jgi:DNA-binding GntR family transcriptional regulator